MLVMRLHAPRRRARDAATAEALSLLRDLDPTVITVGIMGEPVGASLLALAIFGEVPGWWTAAGGMLILAGIYVAVRAQRDVPVPVE